MPEHVKQNSGFNFSEVPTGQEEDMCLISNGRVDLANWFVLKHWRGLAGWLAGWVALQDTEMQKCGWVGAGSPPQH